MGTQGKKASKLDKGGKIQTRNSIPQSTEQCPTEQLIPPQRDV